MRGVLGRLRYRGIQVAGWLLPGAVFLASGPAPRSDHELATPWRIAAAQASDAQEQWRQQQEAQAAYQRGILAAQRGDGPAAEAAWALATQGFRRIVEQN